MKAGGSIEMRLDGGQPRVFDFGLAGLRGRTVEGVQGSGDDAGNAWGHVRSRCMAAGQRLKGEGDEFFVVGDRVRPAPAWRTRMSKAAAASRST